MKYKTLKIFLLVVFFCMFQLFYKLKWEEPYPSLCYPSFAGGNFKEKTFLKNKKRFELLYLKESKNVSYGQDEFLSDSLYQLTFTRGDIKGRFCNPFLYVIKNNGDSVLIKARDLFRNIGITGIAIDRSVNKKLWEYPANQHTYFRKGAPYPKEDIVMFEQFLKKRITRLIKTHRFNSLVVYWEHKKSKFMVKRVKINL